MFTFSSPFVCFIFCIILSFPPIEVSQADAYVTSHPWCLQCQSNMRERVKIPLLPKQGKIKGAGQWQWSRHLGPIFMNNNHISELQINYHSNLETILFWTTRFETWTAAVWVNEADDLPCFVSQLYLKKLHLATTNYKNTKN